MILCRLREISALKTYSKKIYNGRTIEEWERIKTDCKANSWINAPGIMKIVVKTTIFFEETHNFIE